MITTTNILKNPIVRLVGIYIAWIICHYIASHLYVYFCTPLSLMGLILSPFIAAAPHCRALRWAVYNGGVTIMNMWTLLGIWIISKIVL